MTLHPTDVRAVMVYWTPRFDGNTPILRYSIQYKELESTPNPGINYFHNSIHRRSYISAHVLLNLLNELRKRDKMRGLPSILTLFLNSFNKFNKT